MPVSTRRHINGHTTSVSAGDILAVDGEQAWVNGLPKPSSKTNAGTQRWSHSTSIPNAIGGNEFASSTDMHHSICKL
jgi:hypothetical protein